MEEVNWNLIVVTNRPRFACLRDHEHLAVWEVWEVWEVNYFCNRLGALATPPSPLLVVHVDSLIGHACVSILQFGKLAVDAISAIG